ncbi:hypothetical protein PR048_014362 [Dryococelus australis]|uniref:Tudor domain-containing protein n=1 Tax=Dryococelus australis TaxID=614101 RepID=A0ABQ9HE12_9NEOP|nr:hypothetical protein PR048_014362 [Dryococelus australis]
MKFMKGERVRAKWPGSSKYFLGTVLEVGDHKCEVKFDEGTSYSILLKNIFREAPASPGKKSANSIPDHSPSRKTSVERSSRKSSIERTTRKSSMERTTRKSSAERILRSSTERSVRKPSAERQPLKPADRSPSRSAGRALSKPSQELQSRPGAETPVPHSPSRPKSARLSRAPAVASLNANSRLSSDNLPSLESSINESAGDRDSQLVDSYTQFQDRTKGMNAILLFFKYT